MQKKTSIGGQALIEGIMMKGPYKTAMAVRKKDGSIDISEVEEKHLKDKCCIFGWPIIRGMVNLIESMRIGYKTMMQSADISGFTELDEEEPDKSKTESQAAVEATATEADAIETTETKAVGTAVAEAAESHGGDDKTEDKPKEKKENAFTAIVMAVGAVLGVALALLLFMYLPSLAFKGIDYLVPADLTNLKGLIEGLLKMAIFIGYIAVVALEKDIKRVFMYHGAEHKTIFCYESGKELTVENVRGFKRFHPRCGTSFMFLMLAIGILVSSVLVIVLPDFIIDRNYIWVPIKILTLPLTCGLGYELIKICGRHDNVLTRIIAAPGLWIQRLTTKEPDDSMIEIAIAAVKEVIPEDGSDQVDCGCK